MFEFKLSEQTKNITIGRGGKPVKMVPTTITLHHTGTPEGTLKGNLNTLLGKTDRQVSAHFLIDTNGDAYKLSDPTFITFHAGVSQWNGKNNVNDFSIGIEVIGIDSFTDAQRSTVKKLTEHLMFHFKIPKENVLRHADVAMPRGRKTDIHLNFVKPLKTWKEWQDTLVAKAA